MPSRSSLSINTKSISNTKNNQSYVFYTLKKNTKKLKDYLFKLNYLDLKYRISHVKLSSSSHSGSNSSSISSGILALDSDTLKMYVAIPISYACYEIYKKEQLVNDSDDNNISIDKNNSSINKDDDNWMSLVFDCGMQEVLLRSSVFGNRN